MAKMTPSISLLLVIISLAYFLKIIQNQVLFILC
jgi:hypothetical protein